jgi:hypothetical protein
MEGGEKATLVICAYIERSEVISSSTAHCFGGGLGSTGAWSVASSDGLAIFCLPPPVGAAGRLAGGRAGPAAPACGPRTSDSALPQSGADVHGAAQRMR